MLGGMSGTVNEVAGELRDVYGTDVATIPTNRRNCRQRYRERLLASEDDKWRYVVERIRATHAEGRPVLVGARSVVASEHLSELLTREGLPHEVLNARKDKYEAGLVAEAGVRGRITVATNMAGRGTDIKLGEGVTDIGGLHVIATDRHEARRIDRQLFGRCGRQGDPGTHEEIVSLEDQLVEANAGPVALAARAQGGGADARVRKAAVVLAQQRAERLHARMRRATLKTDERVANRLAFSGRSE
jgi:preprotein translocase subunit SecA